MGVKPWETDLIVYQSEEELLEGLRRHDRLACTCLLKSFAPRLYRLAFQLTGNADDAEDVLQEGLIQACAQIQQFEGRSGLGTWLHRIVLNTALMRLRRRTPATLPLPADGASNAAPLPRPLVDTRHDPGEQVVGYELNVQLDAALLRLPPTLRAAVVLRDLEGLSTREAAALLEIGESALKVRLHRAHMALRALLEPYLADGEWGTIGDAP